MSRRAGGRVEVATPVRETRGGVARVTADVGGSPIWFESPDLELATAPEAFASAARIPALHHRLHLRVAARIEAEWLARQAELAAILRDWWRYPDWPVEAEAAAPARAAEGSGGGTALFFSGGVDSFHVLLRGGERVDLLVSLQGFDFPLADRPRADAMEASLRAVAAAAGARAAVVRTNVREHPLVATTPWERAHGGVLGGIAHLLPPAASRTLVASSPPGDREIPWGQHWRVDPLWSSGTVRVAHAGRGGRRIEKLREIADDPLVRHHLRVCWRNLSPTGNCGRCNKCVLAMLILESRGELARSTAFDGREELARRVAGLRATRDRWHTFDEVLREGTLAPDVAREVRALVRRSRHAVRPDVVFRRAVLKRLRGWLGGGKD